MNLTDTFFIQTFGCQMNERDSETLAGMLMDLGYRESSEKEKADIVVINTCSIREHVDERFFGILGQLKKLKENNQDMIVALCGCMMQQQHIIIWEDGIVIETFLKDFAYYLKEQFKINSKLSVNFILDTISSIFSVLNEFKYEDDKRLLGYVLIHELYKYRDITGNRESSKRGNSSLISNVMKIDTVEDVRDIKNENGSILENIGNNDISHLNNLKENHLETLKIDVTESLIENSNYENLIPDTENYTSGIDLSEKKDSHSEYSIDLFEGNWEKIRKEIKNSGAILNALMADTYPEGIKNGVLTIRFPDGHKFHSRQIMELDKKTKIETVINKICNTDIRITTIFDNDNRENSDNEFIEKVINFFDREIIEKK